MPSNPERLDPEQGFQAGYRRLNQETTMKFFNKLLRDEQGATAIEYGLIAALIAVAAITAMGALGNQLSNTFNEVETEMAGAEEE
jgi:pilus assembly protein Flp/PilA